MIDDGIKWYMMACGHRQGNSPESSYGLCPNCEFMARLGITIKIPYPELLPGKCRKHDKARERD